MADISQVKLPNGDTYNLVDETSGYIKSYTETDPVFGASAAAGITSTDISNWNAKVSDDKTWNGVSLTTGNNVISESFTLYVPVLTSSTGTSAKTVKAVASATQSTSANNLVRYSEGGYLISRTPPANDNSTIVATTAYVDRAVGGITIPTKVSDLTNDSGFITSYTDEKLAVSDISVTSAVQYYLIFGDNSTSATTRQYDTTGLRYQVSTSYSELMLGFHSPNKQGKITLFNGGYYKTLLPYTLTSSGIIYLPDANGTIALTSDIPSVYSSTNTSGYLTMATLPIYNGTVV